MIASVVLKDVTDVEEYDILDLSEDFEVEDQGDFEAPFMVDQIDSDDTGWIFYDAHGQRVHLPYGHIVRVMIE